MNTKIILIIFLLISFFNLKSQNLEIKSIQKTIYTTLENSKHKIEDDRYVYFMLIVIKNKEGELLDINYLKSSSFREDERLKLAIEKVKSNWIKKPTIYTTIYLPFIDVYPEKDDLEKENNIELNSFVKMIENFTKRKDLLVAKIYYNVIMN